MSQHDLGVWRSQKSQTLSTNASWCHLLLRTAYVYNTWHPKRRHMGPFQLLWGAGTTFKVLLCLCSSRQSPSSLLRASTARLCSLCSWSFSFIIWSSFFCRTFSCFWSLRCSSSCRSVTCIFSRKTAFFCSTSVLWWTQWFAVVFVSVIAHLSRITLSAHQLSVFFDDGLEFLLRSAEFVQTLHQQHGLLPWRSNIHHQKVTKLQSIIH